MEKLEAALAKAREMRRTALDAPEIAPRRAVTRNLPMEGWTSTLPEIQLHAERMQRNRISAYHGGKDAVPYDMLRSRTIRILKEKDWSRLAITSPGAACGKTTVALNLAISFARQKDLNVMLIDLDLRRPALHKVLGQNPEKSFHQVLDVQIPFEEQAMRIGDNLIVAMNAAPSRHPAELLQAGRTSEILDEIERKWQPDVMLFDMSPMLASDDNVGFLGNVDCALLIAAAESTTLPNIDVCEKELAQLTNVLGVVLNKCRYADGSMGYEYGTYG